MLILASVGRVLAFSVVAHSAQALSTWNISSSDFVRMIWSSTIVVGNYLYIDGGEYYEPGASSWADARHLNATLSIGLSKSWTIASATINSFSKPDELQGTRDGALWWDRNSSSTISFGGEPFGVTPRYIWALTPGGNGAGSWSELYSPGDSLWETFARPGHGLIATSSETGYFMGGMETKFPEDSFWAIPGMVTFDFANRRCTNLTTVGLYSASGMALEGSAQFIPSFSKAGLIIMMGGVVPSSSGDTGGALRPMSNITVYDPYHQNWYSQTATSDVPAARRHFCMVGASSAMATTYEIAAGTTISVQIKILTLAKCTFSQSQRSTGSASLDLHPREQALIVRSSETVRRSVSVATTLTSAAEYATADPWRYGLGIFDMTDLSWRTNYDANAAPYVRSNAVNAYYAKSPLYPSWDNPALGEIFSAGSPTASGTSTDPSISTMPTGTSSPSQATTNSASPTSTTPAIVGGVIGSIAALAVLVAVWWFFFRNRGAPNRHILEHPTEPRYVPELGEARPLEMEARNKPVEMDVPTIISKKPVERYEVQG